MYQITVWANQIKLITLAKLCLVVEFYFSGDSCVISGNAFSIAPISSRHTLSHIHELIYFSTILYYSKRQNQTKQTHIKLKSKYQSQTYTSAKKTKLRFVAFVVLLCLLFFRLKNFSMEKIKILFQTFTNSIVSWVQLEWNSDLL